MNDFSNKERQILNTVKKDLLNPNENDDNIFKLNDNVIDELISFEKKDILNYLVHRYRYEIFPKKKIVDNFPPYLQIEPSSICNYRCVFCFMTDNTLTDKKFGHMGTMKLETFKRIIDSAEGKIEFLSLASRGEPFACKDIDKMLNILWVNF